MPSFSFKLSDLFFKLNGALHELLKSSTRIVFECLRDTQGLFAIYKNILEGGSWILHWVSNVNHLNDSLGFSVISDQCSLLTDHVEISNIRIIES